MQIETPYNVTEILFQRHYPGYLYRREIVDDSEYGGDGHLEVVNCYSADTGQWIGGAKYARYLCKKIGLRNIQKAHESHCVCSIGFSKEPQKWYGWSHRAICGFGIGDKLFEGKFGDDKTLFTQHGTKTIETIDEAKQAAIKFAAYV